MHFLEAFEFLHRAGGGGIDVVDIELDGFLAGSIGNVFHCDTGFGHHVAAIVHDFHSHLFVDKSGIAQAVAKGKQSFIFAV